MEQSNFYISKYYLPPHDNYFTNEFTENANENDSFKKICNKNKGTIKQQLPDTHKVLPG